MQRFLPAPPPTPERMTAVLAQVHEVVRTADDEDLDLDPALAACVQLSLAGPHLAPGSQPAAPPPMTLSAFGMNLHAATTADGRDRKQLERICRYLLRPPFAHDAVTALPGGRVSSPRPRRIAWAQLLARVFALDITRCRTCGGRMRVLEVVSDADAIARILHGARAPPTSPPSQLLLLP